jgi:hypothetical protein
MNCGNAKNAQLGSRYHRGSAVQGQANGRGPNIKSCHDEDNKSALLNVSKTTRLNGNSSRDIFWDPRETNIAIISTSVMWTYTYTHCDTYVSCSFSSLWPLPALISDIWFNAYEIPWCSRIININIIIITYLQVRDSSTCSDLQLRRSTDIYHAFNTVILIQIFL